MNKYFIGLALLLSGAALSYGQQDSIPEPLDAVVVTDSRFELKRENSGKNIITITRKELEENQGRTLPEVINTKSGIEINGTRSVAGQNLGTFIRGGNNRQVLVLIDGVQLSDPSQIANDYDLRLLDLNTVESVEIIKGAASTLYGNSAATAVINITTRKPGNKPITATLTSVVGTNEPQEGRNFTLADFNNHVNVSGSTGSFEYLVGFGNQFTDGLSAVIDPVTNEKDRFSRYNTHLKLGYRFSDSFKMTVYGNQDRFKAAYDNTFPIGDAPFDSESEQYRAGISSEFAYAKGSFTLNTAYNSIFREFESDFPNQFKAESIIVDAYNRYNFSDIFYTVLGLNYVEGRTDFEEEGRSDNLDPYLNVVYVSDFGLNLNAGARLNNHSEYGSNFIYNLNPSYRLESGDGYLKFYGSLATSFIAPSLTQLFGPFGANPDLQPEEDRTLEGGVEWKGSGRFRVSGTYFNRLEQNFIDFVTIDFETFEGEYQNVDTEFTVEGIEVELEAIPLAGLRFTANYTFTESLDRLSLRLPKHKGNASLGYTLDRNTYASLRYSFVGDRIDTDFSTFENQTLEPFSLVDFYLSHTVLDGKLKLFGGMDNIFNTDYTEIIGFTTQGRNVRIGFSLNL